MKYLLLIPLLFFVFFFNQSAYAQSASPQPSLITPTLFCLGSCPTTSVSPTQSAVSQAPSSAPSVSAAPSSTTSVAPSQTISSAPSSNPSPSSIPCTASSSVSTNSVSSNGAVSALRHGRGHGKRHIHGSKGFLQQFIQFLLQLLQKLFQQLGINFPIPGGSSGSPCPSPVPSSSPSSGVSPSSSVSTQPSSQPSIIQNPTPTVFGISPTPSTGSPTTTATAAPTTGGVTQKTNCASNPHLCGFPDATNTGPQSCSNYTAMSGTIKVTTNGATYNCVKLTDGAFDIYANNVTISNSIILGNNWWGINLRGGFSGLKVLHNTITGDAGKGPDHGGEDYGVSASGEVAYNNISEFGEGLATGEGNIHDNYVHDLQAYIPICGSGICNYYQHANAFISSGNNKNPLTIRHNTLLNQLTVAHGASGDVGLFSDFGPVIDVTLDNNIIAGGAYSVYPGGGPTSKNIVVTNNQFSTIYFPGGGFYGAVAGSYWHTGSGNVWSGNVWNDGPNAGKAVNP